MKIAESNIELNNVNSFEFIKTIPDNFVKCIVIDSPYMKNGLPRKDNI